MSTALASHTSPAPTPALAVLPDPAPGTLTGAVPEFRSEEDSLLWARMTPRSRSDWHFWNDDMRRISEAGRGTRGAIITRIARSRGLTTGAIRTKWDRYQREGWTALVNKSRTKTASEVPHATVEFFRTLCHGHQRRKTTASQAYRLLVARWKQWQKDPYPDSPHAIPGYTTPPPAQASTGLPAGWSKTRWIQRAPDTAARTLTALGPKAYSAYLPSIRTTRVGIAPGQIVFFDDEQQDLYVNFLDSNQAPLRPLAFHALDCGSGCNLFRNFKPQITLETGQRRALNQSDFYWFTIAFLTQVGYREDTGTLLVGELGTAAWAEPFRDALKSLTKGKVTFDTSGRFGDPAFRGSLFEGKSCGNSRFKAPIESGFKLIRDYVSILPGATGRNREEAMEETYGLQRYNKWCLDLMQTLPPERALLVRAPLLEWNQYVRLAHDIVEAINRRGEHDLEGWAESGYCVPLIRMGDQSIRLTADFMASADAMDLEFYARLVKAGRATPVRMSPREVWDQTTRGNAPFRRPRPWWIPGLMGIQHARPVKVTDKLEIQIIDREVDPEPMRWLASIENEFGLKSHLTRGQTYLAWLNPYDPSTLHIGDARKAHEGKWIGSCPLIPRHVRGDAEAIHRQIGYLLQETASERYDIERHVHRDLAARTAEKRWNQRLGDTSRPLTPAEHAAAARREEAAHALDTVATPATPKKPVIPDAFG